MKSFLGVLLVLTTTVADAQVNVKNWEQAYKFATVSKYYELDEIEAFLDKGKEANIYQSYAVTRYGMVQVKLSNEMFAALVAEKGVEDLAGMFFALGFDVNKKTYLVVFYDVDSGKRLGQFSLVNGFQTLPLKR